MSGSRRRRRDKVEEGQKDDRNRHIHHTCKKSSKERTGFYSQNFLTVMVFFVSVFLL